MSTVHPIYVMDSAPWLAEGQTAARWTDAGELDLGDNIWKADGPTGEVESVEVVAVQQRMYNLTVDVAHTFFVGHGEWLVHNCGGDGLDWSIVKRRTGETRVEHVRKHAQNDLQKPDHGVFYGDPIKKVEEAWSQKGNLKPVTEGGVDKYYIPSPNSGYSGGYRSQGHNLNYTTIITAKDTTKIITGFPSFAP